MIPTMPAQPLAGGPEAHPVLPGLFAERGLRPRQGWPKRRAAAGFHDLDPDGRGCVREEMALFEASSLRARTCREANVRTSPSDINVFPLHLDE